MKIIKVSKFEYAEGYNFIQVQSMAEFKKLNPAVVFQLEDIKFKTLYLLTDVSVFYVILTKKR